MTTMKRALFLAGIALAMFAPRAGAQSVQLTEMNFDMWCQEQQHLPPERCDKRLPDDDAAFQAYVAKIQNYEVPYLQERQQKDQMNRIILHNDPVDHPTSPSKPPPNPAPPDSPPSN